MLIANFTKKDEEISIDDELWQYDYGQKLQINGLNLPNVFEVHFFWKGLEEAKVTTGYTKDGVSCVDIPNEALKQRRAINVYIYLSTPKEGETVNTVIMSVNKRPIPEGFESPEDVDLFHYTLAAAEEYTKQAKEAAHMADTRATESESWAHGHKLYPERDKDNAKYYANQAKQVTTQSEQNINNIVTAFDSHVEEKKSEVDTALANTIADGTSLKTQLETTISTADTSKSNLDASNTAAGKTKTALDVSNTTATKTKADLDASNTTASEAKTGLDATNKTAADLAASLENKIAEGTQVKNDIQTTGETAMSNLQAEAAKQQEYIKASIDDTLLISGKAADAAVTGKKISSLKEDLSNLNIDNNAGQSLTSEKDISGKYVFFNAQYKLLGFGAGDYDTCKIYKITKDKKYYAIGYGKKNEGYPVAVFSENLVEDGTTPYTDYILGELSTISLSKVSFIAKNDGYIYVNCRNAACGLYENIVIPESTKNANDIKNIEKYKLATYGEFENVNIDIKKGFLYNVLLKEEKPFDNTRYCKLEIDDTIDMIKATGYSFPGNSEYPFICFLDEYGNIVETYGKPSTGYNDCLMKIPYRTKSIIVNGQSKITIQKFVLKENLAQEIKELSSPVTMDRLKGMKVLNEKYESKTIETSENEILSGIVYTDSGNQSTSDLFSTVIIPIELSLKSIKILYSVGIYGGAFLDNQKKWISSFSTESNGLIYDVPDYATYIGYTFANSRTSFQLGITFNVYTSKQLILQGNSFFANPWEGKKVVLLGTSVGFGSNATKAYIQEASNYLGFTLVNTSVPGLAIHTNSDGTKLTYGSTCLSVAEYKEQGMTIPDAPKDYIPGGSYNDYYRTWEHIFSAENADADLWLYAVAPNNGNFKLDDWNLFDKSNWKYTDESSFASHRTTFLGALLYLMDKMYTLNPKARMAFVLDSAFAYGDAEGKGNLKTVSDQWGIPIIDLWGKINRSPKSLAVVRSKDGTDSHPSTFAHEKMGMMMVGEMLRLG